MKRVDIIDSEKGAAPNSFITLPDAKKHWIYLFSRLPISSKSASVQSRTREDAQVEQSKWAAELRQRECELVSRLLFKIQANWAQRRWCTLIVQVKFWKDSNSFRTFNGSAAPKCSLSLPSMPLSLRTPPRTLSIWKTSFWSGPSKSSMSQKPKQRERSRRSICRWVFSLELGRSQWAPKALSVPI